MYAGSERKVSPAAAGIIIRDNGRIICGRKRKICIRYIGTEFHRMD